MTNNIVVKYATNTNPVVIRGSLNEYNLSTLHDVIMEFPNDGNTLVYNAEEEKFILEPLTNINISNIDGGSF